MPLALLFFLSISFRLAHCAAFLSKLRRCIVVYLSGSRRRYYLTATSNNSISFDLHNADDVISLLPVSIASSYTTSLHTLNR